MEKNVKNNTVEKTLTLGRRRLTTQGKEEKGSTEGELVGWHHRLDGGEFNSNPGDREGQGSLECRSPADTRSQTLLSN